MSKKINAQKGSKKSTLRVARPIGDTQKYYEILRNTKKYQKILRKSNEKIKSCSAGAKTEDTKSCTPDRRHPAILRNTKK